MLLSIASLLPQVTLGSVDMDGIEITYRLRRLGLSQTDIARELGISASVVSNTIHNRVTCHRAAVRIAELLGETVQMLWPGRYEFKPRINISDLETKS